MSLKGRAQHVERSWQKRLLTNWTSVSFICALASLRWRDRSLMKSLLSRKRMAGLVFVRSLAILNLSRCSLLTWYLFSHTSTCAPKTWKWLELLSRAEGSFAILIILFSKSSRLPLDPLLVLMERMWNTQRSPFQWWTTRAYLKISHETLFAKIFIL